MGLPRYMIEKVLASGAIAYYWRPPGPDLAAGFSLHSEPLGADFVAAKARAAELNLHLDSWRAGREDHRELDLQPGYGTLEWMIERYKRSPAWKKVSERSRPDYQRAFDILCSVPRKSGGDIGSAPIATIDAKAVDKIYEMVKQGPRGGRLRQANLCILRTARASDVVHRLYRNVVPPENPFRGVELDYGKAERPAATRELAVALHKALIAASEPHLAAAR
jgi:hypothetical protein